MISAPPNEREWLSWTFVAVWALVLLATLPLAPLVMRAVERHTGKWIAVVLVVVIVVVFLVVASRRLIQAGHAAPSQLVWLAAAAAIVIALTSTSKTPIEGFHFIQYGVLGALAFRAFAHRTRDLSVYAAAALLGTIVGTIDEAIQWILPGRVWDVRDIQFNATGAILAQVTIALAARPPHIAAQLSRSGVHRLCWLSIVAVVVIGASFLNTPERIEWYTGKSRALGVLVRNATVMAEYGYMHVDADIGRFRSRLSKTALRQADAQIGAQTGPLLDALREDGGYRKFLREYHPRRSAMVHEAAVHLATRKSPQTHRRHH